MTGVMEMQIFFIIASVGTVLFIVLLSLVLFQVLKVVQCIRRIMERIEAGSETLADDMAAVRTVVASGMIGRFFGFRAGRRQRTHDDEAE